MTAVDN